MLTQLRKRRMPRKFHKYKLLFDENLPPKTSFPKLNKRFDIKHLVIDLDKGGLTDSDVYLLAAKEQRLILTFNIKHFKLISSESQHTGVIGLSRNLSNKYMVNLRQ